MKEVNLKVEISIEIKDEQITISFGSDAFEDIVYSVENEINLTKLVNTISEINKEVIIKPGNFEEFTGIAPQTNQTLIKVIEYIYKIIERYNQCYKKIYEEQTQENKESIA